MSSYELIDKIIESGNLKELDIKQLDKLADEIRSFLIENVSKTGGHVASNLGVIELTIALHYVLDLPKDKIIWDVGHQAYVHKLLSGRRDGFETLRQLNGMSGFPKRIESEFDSFNTGHSSTSISAALGIARARDIDNNNFNVCAVIGDGAMTGGMAFEALNDAANTNTKMVVILNDNEMSIGKNVGGLSAYLSNLRMTKGYRNFADNTVRFLSRIPGGKSIIKVMRKIKNLLKFTLLQDSFFEQLGFRYYGPIYGHDTKKLIDVLEQINKIDAPVLLHILTKKGKGYEPAEKNPGAFHGISAFDIETGKTIAKSQITYSNIFGNQLVKLARENDKVVAITAAMEMGTGLTGFASEFPSRFFDVGIAEQHAVTFAAGLATQGFVPVVAIYSTFMQRAYDQILHDVALQKLHVVFALDRAGVVGEDGETHQGVYDLSYLSTIPGLTVLAPADYYEFNLMLDYAINKADGPIAIRYPRGVGKNELYSHTQEDVLTPEIVRDGEDFTIVAIGKMVEVGVDVCDILSQDDISCCLINIRCLKQKTLDVILSSIEKTRGVAVLEDNIFTGGLCAEISQRINCVDNNFADKAVMQFAYPDEPIEHGKINLIAEKYGLTASQIAKKISERLGER